MNSKVEQLRKQIQRGTYPHRKAERVAAGRLAKAVCRPGATLADRVFVGSVIRDCLAK